MRARLIVICGFVLACGPKHGGSGHVAGAEFPKEEELVRIAGSPVPPPQARPVADVESWKLTGPLRTTVDAAPYPGTTAWDALAAASVATPTEAMHCVARELGQFMLSNAGDPPQDLVMFIAARCGSDLAELDREAITFDMSESASEDEVVRQAHDDVASMIARYNQPHSEIGISFARNKTKGVVVVTGGARKAEFQPVALFADANGSFVIRGKLSFPAHNLTALINQGRWSVTPCVTNPAVALPDFEVSCPGANDDSEWLELGATPEGHLLSYDVLSTIVFPHKKPGDLYKRPAFVISKGAETDLTVAFLAGLNEFRDSANLGRVHEVKSETAMANRLAPYYFGFLRSNPLIAERIALGLMAGWDVDEPIRYGKMSSAWTTDTGDPRRVLASYLEHPNGRSVLLDPEATLMSIGLAPIPGRATTGTIVTSWAPMGIETQDTRVARALAHIADLRAARKLPPAHKVAEDGSAAIAMIEQQHQHPDKALRELLKQVSASRRQGVRGLLIETSDLSDFTLPDELAAQPNLDISVSVAWALPPGHPWGHYYIFIVVPESVKA